MNWQEFSAASQMLSEERVGQRVREAEKAEDAAFAALKKAFGQKD